MPEITDIGMCRCAILDYYCKVGGAVVDKLAASSKNGEPGPFIDFMLDEIYQTLKAYRGKKLSQ